jgi:hypothetical protein
MDAETLTLIWAVVASVVALGEKIAKATATTKDDEVVGKVRAIINKIGNFMSASFIKPTK